MQHVWQVGCHMLLKHIHRTIRISFRSSKISIDFFIGHVSEAYDITLATHAAYIFPFVLHDTYLDVKIGFSSLNFFHAHPILVTTAASAPPPTLSMSPK